MIYSGISEGPAHLPLLLDNLKEVRDRSSSSPDSPRKEKRKPRILVVEDDPQDLHFMRQALTEAEFEPDSDRGLGSGARPPEADQSPTKSCSTSRVFTFLIPSRVRLPGGGTRRRGRISPRLFPKIIC